MSEKVQQDAQTTFGPGPAGLYRDPKRGRIAGVCAGLSDYIPHESACFVKVIIARDLDD